MEDFHSELQIHLRLFITLKVFKSTWEILSAVFYPYNQCLHSNSQTWVGCSPNCAVLTIKELTNLFCGLSHCRIGNASKVTHCIKGLKIKIGTWKISVFIIRVSIWFWVKPTRLNRPSKALFEKPPFKQGRKGFKGTNFETRMGKGAWSFCQLVILSTGQFLILLFCLFNSSIHHFVNWFINQFAILSTGHFINLPFSQLFISSICHFVNWSIYHFELLSSGKFINFPFCQLVISSFWNFINWSIHHFAICQLVLSSICHFVNWSMQHFVIFSTGQFINLQLCQLVNSSFCQLVDSSICHFINLSTHQCTILSTCQFIKLSFSKLPTHHFAILSMVNSSICHFVNLSNHLFAIFSTGQFINLPFGQLVNSSICHYVNFSNHQFAIFFN